MSGCASLAMQNNSQIPNLTNNDFTAWTGTLEQVRQKNVPACKAALGENCQAFVSQTDRADHLVILLADEIETRYEFYNQLHGCPQLLLPTVASVDKGSRI